MTGDLKNSAASPGFNLTGWREVTAVTAALTLLITAAASWISVHGFVLYYGDAQAHLNIARSILDSRTPGYDQLGTVWLPLLHVLCLPLVVNDAFWSTGLAGLIPVALCFIVAGLFVYLAAKEAFYRSLPAVVVLGCFALNPNVLYLSVIPMTETVFMAGVAVLLFALLRFRRTQSRSYLWRGVLASWWMSLTRYDGWFLIPFTALCFAYFAQRSRWLILISFGLAASLAPAYWLAHNWYEAGNALDFYNGPYSAGAIQGSKSYPGYHDWPAAFAYYMAAGLLCSGLPLMALGIAGVVCAIWKKAVIPIVFLLLTPLFYIWSIHSSKVPIFVPELWPHGYYNTRYGIALVAAAAFAAGAVVLALPWKWRNFALAIPLLSLSPWLLHPTRENWICWKESQVNSVARRAWTGAAARFLVTNYHVGEGIIASFGDPTGIFGQSRIPLAEVLHIGNGPEWLLTTSRPDLIHRELWAVAQEGDALSRSISGQKKSPYQIFERIETPGAPALEIYRRSLKLETLPSNLDTR